MSNKVMRNIDDLCSAAEKRMKAHAWAEALEIWTEARAFAPENRKVWERSAWAHMELGNLDAAENLLNEAREKFGESVSLDYIKGHLYLRQWRYAEATSVWGSLLAQYPDNREYQALEMSALIQMRAYREVETKCGEAIARDANNFVAWKMLASCAQNRSENREALSRWNACRQKFLDEISAWTGNVSAALAAGDSHAAYAIVLKMMDRWPDDARAITCLGDYYMAKLAYKQALNAWEKGLELFPCNEKFYWGRSKCHSLLGNCDDALLSCLEGQHFNPASVLLMSVEIEILRQRGESRAALEKCATLREKCPLSPHGYILAARQLLDEVRYREAQELCAQGLEKFAQVPPQIKISLITLFLDSISRQNDSQAFALGRYFGILHSDVYFMTSPAYLILLPQLVKKHLAHLSKNGLDPLSDEFIDKTVELYLSNKYFIDCGMIINFLNHVDNNFNPELTAQLIEKFIYPFINISDHAALLSRRTEESRVREAIQKLVLNGDRFIIKCARRSGIYWKFLPEIMEKLFIDKKLFNLGKYDIYYMFRIFSLLDQKGAEEKFRMLVEHEKDSGNEDIKIFENRLQNREELLKNRPDIIHPKNRKLRIAICISGQLRGYKKAYKSLLGALDFDRHDVTVFVHTWKDIGGKLPTAPHADRLFTGEFLTVFKRCFQGRETGEIKNAYPEFVALFEDRGHAQFNELCDFYNTSHVCIEDDTRPPFNMYDNAKKMHYKKFSCINLTALDDFDLVAWLRPDAFFTSPAQISLAEIYRDCIQNGCIYISTWGGYSGKNDSAYCLLTFCQMGFTIDETIMIGTPAVMKMVGNTFVELPDLWRHGEIGCPLPYSGHDAHDYQLFRYGVHVKDLHGTEHSFIDAEKIPIEEIYTALKKDIASRTPDLNDKELLDACLKDMAVKSSGVKK